MDLLSEDAVDVAPKLLGWKLRSHVGGEETTVELTEVEAYREDDPASHSFLGRTRRNLTMFGPAGRLYVYRSYGLHWAANVVTGPDDWGSAVLLRAGRPVEGVAVMRRRRGRDDHLTDGPGKLCQALGIDGSDDGADLLGGGRITLVPGTKVAEYVQTPRIGISKAVDRPWRFVAATGG